jgi:hypothetical protein
MGLLGKLFGKKKQSRKPAPAPRPSFDPNRSIIDEPELRTVADLNRHYPLPPGFEYHQGGTKPIDIVVVRQSDGERFLFLVEEGLLSFDVPQQKEDGTWGKRTTEVFRIP